MSESWDAIEEQKAASTLQLLFKAARLVNEEAIARLREETGLSGLRAVHTQLFPHIDPEGTRLTTLAERVGVSKQAVGQLVDELEQMGGLVRVPDPSDGRAKLIRFEEGALMRGLGFLRQMEAELAREVGEARVGALREALLAILGRYP